MADIKEVEKAAHLQSRAENIKYLVQEQKDKSALNALRRAKRKELRDSLFWNPTLKPLLISLWPIYLFALYFFVYALYGAYNEHIVISRRRSSLAYNGLDAYLIASFFILFALAILSSLGLAIQRWNIGAYVVTVSKWCLILGLILLALADTN